MDVRICESRSMEDSYLAEGHEPVAEARMTFNTDVPKGTPVVIALTLDGSGLLHVSAEEMYGHSKLDAELRLTDQMSEEEKRKAMTRLKGVSVE